MINRIVVGAHYGLRDWIVQRATAVIMAVYSVIIAAVLLVAAPLMGAAFAMFLPFIGIALVLDFVAKKAWKVTREAVHGTMMAVSTAMGTNRSARVNHQAP